MGRVAHAADRADSLSGPCGNVPTRRIAVWRVCDLEILPPPGHTRIRVANLDQDTTIRRGEGPELLVRAAPTDAPFVVLALPAIARLYAASCGPFGSRTERLKRLLVRQVFRLLYRLGMGGRGRMALRSDPTRRLTFNARNLQFSSVYLPEFGSGYESETLALLSALVEDRSVFWDIGSNWGYFALAIATQKGFDGRVHAFEPFPSTFDDLRALVREAHLEDRIECHQLAASDFDGIARMALPDRMHSGLATITSDAPGPAVEARRLDDLAIQGPDVIKLDVEGHELRALLGAKHVIERNRPMIVLESWWPGGGIEPLRVLAAERYETFQPVWMSPKDLQDEALPRDTDVLALIAFTLHQRPIMREHINVFACPIERLGELRRLFRPL